MSQKLNDGPVVLQDDPDHGSVLGRLTSLLALRPVASLLVAAAAGYLIGRLQDEPE